MFECVTVCLYVTAGVRVCASVFVCLYMHVSDVLSGFLIDRVCICICVLVACVNMCKTVTKTSTVGQTNDTEPYTNVPGC